MRNIFLIFSLFIILIFIYSCEKKELGTEPIGNIVETDSTIVYSILVGINGGIVRFDDNTILEVPPGSLEKDANITILRIKNSKEVPSERELLILEPEGLIFKMPAKLTLSYADIKLDSDNFLQAFSCKNGIWEELSILNIDELSKVVQIELKHFSILLLKKQLDMYLVVDIPGEFLKKGDLLYTLSLTTGFDKFYWIPGHTALYLGTDNPGSIDNDGQLLIESTPSKVRISNMNTFINSYDHLFMGARRYDGIISEDERYQIAQYAINQLDKPYLLVGQGNVQEVGFSCVGLTEAAYENAGLNIIPALLEIPYSLPYDQYKYTKPIDEINLKVGEEIELKVYGVIWNEIEKYVKTSDGVGISNPPSGSTWTKSNNYYSFRWTPGINDADKTFNLTFKVQREITNGLEQQSQSIAFEIIPTGVPPISAFSASSTSIIAGENVQFIDQSTNNPTSWSWNFGDGETSTLQNPSHTYSTAGTYTVVLSATNNFGSGTETKTNYITVTSSGGGETITDIDGNVYNAVSIGSQTWMKENLKTTKYNDGTVIAYPGTDNTAWQNITTGAFAWYNNDIANKAVYGALYNWYAVFTGNLCPTGWHVPTDAEWTTLTSYLGGESVAGGKLKEAGFAHWLSPNTGADNSSGFTALPGGIRAYFGQYLGLSNDCFWWSSTEYDATKALSEILYYGSSGVGMDYAIKTSGFSIRCLKD